MTSSPHLSAAHLEELWASVIADDVIAERGYQTITNPRALPTTFTGKQRDLDGLLIPIRDVTGEIVTSQLKPRNPRERDGTPIKYETAAAGRTCLDVPARSRQHLRDVNVPLWITEGSKKVDSGLSNGVPCIIGVQGVWGWMSGQTALPDWREIALADRDVVIAFDSDVMRKASARRAIEQLGAFLEMRKARVRFLLTPDLDDGAKCGLDDSFASGRTRLALDDLIVDELPGSEMDWETPVPLDDPAGPPFPLNALPDEIGTFVSAVAEETQTPEDMPAIVALGTISAAAGGKYQVEVTNQGWEEPVHIMTMPVVEPGARKTAIFRKITEPIVAHERAVKPDEERAYAQWLSRNRALEKSLASAESAAGKPPQDGKIGDPEAIRMAAVDALETHKVERPRITRIITDDATPEVAKSLMAEQGGAVAAMGAESAFLSNTAGGRYSESPNLDVILNGHAGDGFTVDRKGRPSESVERACLTLCLMVQPQVIRDIGKAPGFITRGGAARLLPCFPEDVLGHRRVDVAPVSRELAGAWSSIITRIVTRQPEMRSGSYIPWSIHLSTEALKAFRTYREWHEPRMAKDGAAADIRDWAGKQCGAVLRIAGLLHIACHHTPEDVPVTSETLQRAIVITGYFEEHARIMYQMMAGRSNHGDARTVLAALKELGSPTTRRDLHRKLHNRVAFATSDDLSAPLRVLEECGFIERFRDTGDQGGRPSERIALNPSEMDDRTDNTPSPDTPVGGSVGSVIVLSEHKPPPMPNVLEPTGTDGGLSDDDWEVF